MMYKQLQRWTRISLIVVYLVIAAGATVRMTGSGMGCPDWPKCFGYLIPPTDAAQLEWKPNTKYNEGNVIIDNERLLVASASFTTTDQFNSDRWEPYTKHDYAVFDAKHTWIEFINRLLGALSGLAILILFGFSIKWIRKKPIIFIFSLLSLLMDGVKMCSRSSNLGDSRTIVTQPAISTPSKLSVADRLAVGITDGLVRISVGLEHPDDIIQDLKQALDNF